MKDVFDVIDGWNNRWNLFRDPRYIQRVLLYFVLLSIVLWVMLGFDSGVGILEDAVRNFPSLVKGNMSFDRYIDVSYTTYGRSFHFSSFVIYGLLFFALSKYLTAIGVRQSRNVFYSIFLTILNVALFELIYMALFAHFQMHRNLMTWLVEDLWFLQQYFMMLLLGVLGFCAFWVESYKIENKKVVGRSYTFQPNKELMGILFIGIFVWTLWVCYPFGTTTATIAEWSSSSMFPQTHYAYVDAELYVRNDWLHAVNVVVKAMFALCQLYLITRFKPTTQEDGRHQTLAQHMTHHETRSNDGPSIVVANRKRPIRIRG